jgi:hypothetical protein
MILLAPASTDRAFVSVSRPRRSDKNQMNSILLLAIALVWNSSLIAVLAAETNAPGSTNLAQGYLHVEPTTGWMDTKVNLYRTKGGMVQLAAKRQDITGGAYIGMLAFVDPETGNAWAGGIPSPLFNPSFYLETESGILRGSVYFLTIQLGGTGVGIPDVRNGAIADGRVNWFRSVVPTMKRGENLDDVIEQLNRSNALQSVAMGMDLEKVTAIQDSLHGVDHGLNPWLFVDGRCYPRSFLDEPPTPSLSVGQGPILQDAVTTITGVDVSDGKLRLDLRSPTGSHTASVWIDLKTCDVVKAIQDGKP